MKKRFQLSFALCMFAICVSLCACGKQETVDTNKDVEEDVAEKQQQLLTGKHYAMIEVRDYGNILVELDADAAPVSTTNFMKLVNEGFYDGLTFHRVIKGFMIQGGDPTGTGVGGSGDIIYGEFAKNGFENSILHERGTISMARSNNYNSASSQFFICQEKTEWLDGDYAAFGHVISGMEVVDAICDNTPVIDNNGSVEKENQPVIEGISDVTAEYVSTETEEMIPSNELEELAGKTEFESYDEILSYMTDSMSYAYVNILGWEEPVLLINCEGTYDFGDGTMVALQAYPYLPNESGNMVCSSIFSSMGTAYPIALSSDGTVFTGGNHGVEVSAITTENGSPAIMEMAFLYESYDENGNVTYGGFVRDKNVIMNNDGREIAEDDSETIASYYEQYSEATPIVFCNK